VSRSLALLELPADIQQQVDAGELAARAAYELSKLPDDETQRELADKAVTAGMTHKQAANAVRQRRGKPKAKPRCIKRTFLAENGWEVVVKGKKKGTYYDIQAALEQALEDVRIRIKSNIHLIY
jgi:ParB family chromosome partitioning protein